MARRRRGRARLRTLLVAAIAIAIAAIAWMHRERILEHFRAERGTGSRVADAAPDRLDRGNEGRRVRIAGRLEFAQAARDPQLGVSANAAVLFRDVAIFQWHEHCAADDCRYDRAWSSAPVDSRRFRHAAGHENPAAPFASARFAAAGLRLGAFAIDPALAAAQLGAQPLPVAASDLPPNLAVSFQAVDGALYAGAAGQPQVGALKVSYRIVAPGEAALTGVQRGDHLVSR